MNHSPGFLRLTQDARTRINEIRLDALKRRLDAREAFHLIDVREDGEWVAGHIPGAVHIGRGVLERDIERALPDKGADIVLYCGGGYRSALAADSLLRMGYRGVASFFDGWTAWKKAGLPIAR